MEYIDFLQLVLSRQSDRAYDKERSVEAEKLERILEAGRLAPSACNAQPWKFVVITDRELALKVGKAAESEGLGSCILGWFDEKEIKRLTGIPASKRLLLDIAIGYPIKEKRKKMRKPQEKVVSYNRY